MVLLCSDFTLWLKYDNINALKKSCIYNPFQGTFSQRARMNATQPLDKRKTAVSGTQSVLILRYERIQANPLQTCERADIFHATRICS